MRFELLLELEALQRFVHLHVVADANGFEGGLREALDEVVYGDVGVRTEENGVWDLEVDL